MSSVCYNVTPFNEFALGTCFEEAFVPAFQYFGGDKYQFILNRCIYFRYMGDSFCVSAYDMERREDMEEKNGVKSECFQGIVPNLSEKIISELDKGNLPICRTSDAVAYNERVQRKTQKSRSLHWMLIFGYDTEKKVFHVLEHLTNVAAQYEPCVITFENLETAYVAGCKYIDSSEDDDTLVVVKPSNGPREERKPFSVRYFEKCKKIKERLECSYESLSRYLNSFLAEDRKIEQYDMTVFNEVVRYFEKELWIQDTAGVTVGDGKGLLQKFYLIRAYCMKCMNRDNELNRNGLKKASSEALVLVDEWYKSLFAQILRIGV